VTIIAGLGEVPTHWRVERAKWLLHRQRRIVRAGDAVVTAFRDGQVTLRSNRRLEGFTEAIQEIGYQGIRKGDLVVHSMDGFAGAIGVSDSDGKASPVVHVYTPAYGVDERYVAYVLRRMALSGLIASLAKGIRERSTAFDAVTLAELLLPVPPLEDQRRIADFLDAETARIDNLVHRYMRLRDLIIERRQRLIDAEVECVPARVPLRYLVFFREGPGIMAEDFRSDGVPLLRVAGLRDGRVTLDGCNFLDPQKVATKWNKFKVKVGDRILSGSATMGAVSGSMTRMSLGRFLIRV